MSVANIIAASELNVLREHLSGRVVVLATGCFDILHVGHIYFLKEARAQGDVLVVGINSDRAVKLIKGQERPIVGQNDRATILAAFRDVNYVFIFDDTVADDSITRLRPNVFAIGEESVKAYPSESIAAEAIGARVHHISRLPAPSTTSIMADIKQTLDA